ncbi:MAG: hypothetical protein J5919_02760 [Clostridia bacterium]|nr:hypothetical protein [Clostridia bacterium]
MKDCYDWKGEKIPFAPRDTDGISRRYSVTLCLILILVPAAAAAAVIFSEDIRIPLIWLLAAPSAVSIVTAVLLMPAVFRKDGGRLYVASRIYLTFGRVFSFFYAAGESLLAAFVLIVSVAFAWAVRKIGELTAAAVEAVKNNEVILKIVEADKLHVIEKLFRKLVYFLQSLVPEEGREAVATASKVIEHIGAIAAGFVAAAFVLFVSVAFLSVVRHLLYGSLRGRLRRLFSDYYTYERRKIRALAAEFRREERDRRRGRLKPAAAERSGDTAETATQTEAQTADASAGGPTEIRASETEDDAPPEASAGELPAGSAPDTAEDMLSDAFDRTPAGAVETCASDRPGEPSSGTLEGIAPEVPDRKREREERRAKRKEKRARRRSVRSKLILGFGLAGFACRAALLFFISPWLAAVGALQGAAVAVFALMIGRFGKMKASATAESGAPAPARE